MIELLRRCLCGSNRCVKVEWVLGLLALLGLFAVLFVTAWGCGLSPDSVVYLDTATNLLRGNGWSFGATDGVLRPMTQYPPLFPSVVALISLTGMDVPDAARWFNAILFAGTIFLTGLAVSRYTQGSFWPAVLVSFFVLTCVPLIRIFSSALSEAAFIFFGLSGMFLLSIYLKERSPGWLVTAALGVALSCLSRYVGVTFIAAGILGLLFLNRKPLAARVADIAVWGIVSSAPVAIWATRNLSLSGHVSRYATHINVATTSKIRQHLGLAIRDAFASSLPDKVPVEIRLVAFLGVVGLLIALSVALLRRRKDKPGATLRPAYLGPLPYVLIFFSAAYCGFISASIVLFQQGALNERFMTILYAIAFILLACWFYRLSNLLRAARTLKLVLLITTCGLAFVQTGYSTIWVLRRHSEGLGYAARTWHESAIVLTLKDLPAETLVVTNEAIPLYYLTGHPTYQLLVGEDLVAMSDEALTARLKFLTERLRGDAAVLACFESTTCLELAGALGEVLPLRVIGQENESAIYAAAP